MLARGTKVRKNEVIHLSDGITKIIAIHKGEPMEILIDTTDWPLLEPYSWYVEKAKKTYYAASQTGACENGGRKPGKRMHAVLFPDAAQIDHIDRNGLNNCRSNLRPATYSQNNANRSKHSKFGKATSDYLGVSWEAARKKWVAGIKKDGIRRPLGRFNDALEAALVRDKAAIETFGTYASLNFPAHLVEAYADTMRCFQSQLAGYPSS